MRKEGFERDRYWWRSWEREAGAPSVKKKKKERKRKRERERNGVLIVCG